MSLDFLYLRGAFRDKCDSFNFTSNEGCTEVQEGSFESPESNKQAYQNLQRYMYLWRPYKRLKEAHLLQPSAACSNGPVGLNFKPKGLFFLPKVDKKWSKLEPEPGGRR